MSTDLNQLIHIKLLDIVEKELELLINAVETHVKEQNITYLMQNSGRGLLLDIQPYLSSSRDILHNLSTWSKGQLLGKQLLSTRIRFHMEILILHLKLNEYKNVEITNHTCDYPLVRLDVKLMCYIFNKLLVLLLKHYDDGGKLILESRLTEGHVVFSISEIDHVAYSKLGNSSLGRDALTANYTFSEDDGILSLCYEILWHKGGNLWSEYNESGRCRLHFSIPNNKSA